MSMNVPIIDFDFKINLRQPYTYDGVGGMGSSKYDFTRKYPLRGYILGVLTHTTAWDRLWGDDVF